MKCVLHADEWRVAEGVDVVVPWWSFTKTLISALALTLVRDGRLSLDDSVRGEAFSLRELLLHRAGLADYGALSAYHAAVAAGEDAWPFDDLLVRVAPLHAKVQRGEFCYSNVGYLLVRRHLEQLTGLSLGQALYDRLCLPLGITGLTVAERRNDLDAVHPGLMDVYDPRWVYHGLALGTLRDATSLLHRIMTSDLLPEHLRNEMCAGLPVGDPGAGRPWRVANYGLGMMTGITTQYLRVAGHTGGAPGSGIAVYHCPETLSTVAGFLGGSRANDAERETFALGAEI